MASSNAPTNASYRLHADKRQIFRPGSSGKEEEGGEIKHLFSNERMKVSDFRLQPSQTFKCKHEYSTIRWQVAYNGISKHHVSISNNDDRDTKNNDEALSGTIPDRQVFHVEAGTTWEITNTSTTAEYRQIIFEFQSNKPRYTQHEIQELFAQAKYSTNVGTKLLYENELCRCWDFYLEPSEGGGIETVHHHCLDYVFINVSPSRLLGIHPVTLSGENLLFDSVSEDNQVTWNSIPRDAATDISYAHGGKNGYNDRPMREYLIELK